jgi:putative chitinase
MRNSLHGKIAWVVPIFFLVASCKKTDRKESVDLFRIERQWVLQNGGIYKTGTLQVQSPDGTNRKIVSLDWSQAKRFYINNVRYTEIPFTSSNSGNNGRVQGFDDNDPVEVTFSFIMRQVSQYTEAAIKYTIRNAKLNKGSIRKEGTIESYAKLDGTWVNSWFIEDSTGSLMARKGDPLKGQTQATATMGTTQRVKAMNMEPDLECNYYLIYGYEYQCVPSGGPYNDTECGYVPVEYWYQYCTYTNDGGGGGNGGGSGGWPPTSGGGSGDGTQPPSNNPAGTPCATSGAALKTVFKTASQTQLDKLADYVNTYGGDFGLNTADKLRHFLAQGAAETGYFGTLNKVENLNYSTASLLEKNYKRYFDPQNPHHRDASKFLNKPEELGNLVYSHNNGNGDSASGEGYLYRGRGVFQLTGKENYQAFKDFYNGTYTDQIDPVTSPAIVASNDKLSVLSAMYFFKKHVLDKITVDSSTTVKQITKIVNGGSNGLIVRMNSFDSLKVKINCL